MKSIKQLSAIVIITGLALMQSCNESFLEITPNGVLDESVLAVYDGVDGLLIGAYSLLDGISPLDNMPENWAGATSGWVYGSIRGMESNKGSDAGDQSYINSLQSYTELSENLYLNTKWKTVYEGISRCNATITTAQIALEEGNITEDETTWFIRQARALRGYYHLEAWRIWADMSNNSYVPYVDENTDPFTVSNEEDIRSFIIEDLTAGTALPNDMGQVGRFNKSTCQVLLAKAYMQMYRNYDTAKGLLKEVVDNGTNPAGQKAQLEPKYSDVFDAPNRNGVESIYTVQYSVNDGSSGWNAGYGEVLNFPYNNGPGACCGFFQPTQDFVNSFRTDADGLPFLDNSYNDEKVTNDQGVKSEDSFDEYTGQLDPRLDWSVGRRGIPYWDWGVHGGNDWIRDQTFSGPYSPKKQVYQQSQEGIYTEVGNWTSGWTANGYRLIRYADVLLLYAECKAMTNDGDLGLKEVNDIRTRAANEEDWVKNEDGTNAANYVIGTYPSFANQEEAMTAIRFERKLELGQEGHRYYDLQRWGIVQEELNRIMGYEKTMEWGQNAYGSNPSIGPEDVNFPIPQRQIDLSAGNLVQNR